jgi:hypothetical protein
LLAGFLYLEYIIQFTLTSQAGGEGEKGDMIRKAAADAVAAARGRRVVYCCGWATCATFCDSVDAISEHVMREHVTAMALQCCWTGCNAAVFPNRNRLARHFNDVHLASSRQELPMSAGAITNPAPPPSGPKVVAPAVAPVAAPPRAHAKSFLSRAYLQHLAGGPKSAPPPPPKASAALDVASALAALQATLAQDVAVLQGVVEYFMEL